MAVIMGRAAQGRIRKEGGANKTRATIAGTAWQYMKVPYDPFQASTAATFSELVSEITIKRVS